MAEPTDRIRGILTARFIVLCVLRALALIFLLYAAYALCVQIFLGDVLISGITGFSVIYDNLSYSGIAFGSFIVGLVLALASKRLSRWIVPAMRLECPQCAYNLHLIKGNTCPECGYIIASPRESKTEA